MGITDVMSHSTNLNVTSGPVYPSDVTHSSDGHMGQGGVPVKNEYPGPSTTMSRLNSFDAFDSSGASSSRDPSWAYNKFKDTIGLFHNQGVPSDVHQTGYPGATKEWLGNPMAGPHQYYPPMGISAAPQGYHTFRPPWDPAMLGILKSEQAGNHHPMLPASTNKHPGYAQMPYSIPGRQGNTQPRDSPGPIRNQLSPNITIQDMEAERATRRARRPRTTFTKHQADGLEQAFAENKYPDVYRREELSSQLELKEEIIRVWFKNRRAKLKKDLTMSVKKDPEMDLKPSASGSPSGGKSSLPYPPTYPNTSQNSNMPLNGMPMNGGQNYGPSSHSEAEMPMENETNNLRSPAQQQIGGSGVHDKQLNEHGNIHSKVAQNHDDEGKVVNGENIGGYHIVPDVNRDQQCSTGWM